MMKTLAVDFNQYPELATLEGIRKVLDNATLDELRELEHCLRRLDLSSTIAKERLAVKLAVRLENRQAKSY